MFRTNMLWVEQPFLLSYVPEEHFVQFTREVSTKRSSGTQGKMISPAATHKVFRGNTQGLNMLFYIPFCDNHFCNFMMKYCINTKMHLPILYSAGKAA